VNFPQWLEILQKEAQQTSSQYVLIKRRIAWLIGKWHFDDVQDAVVDVRVWEILYVFLTDRSTGSDAVVRYAAVSALYECVEVSLLY
jgi:hypothetical protein